MSQERVILKTMEDDLLTKKMLSRYYSSDEHALCTLGSATHAQWCQKYSVHSQLIVSSQSLVLVDYYSGK